MITGKELGRKDRYAKGEYYANRKRKFNKQQNDIEKARIYFRLSEQYGEVCMVTECGWNECLELHRVNPGCTGGLYELANCVLLCPNHHALITKGLKTTNELIPTLN